MATSLKIYNLINCLNKTEKAYLKKFGFKYISNESDEFILYEIINAELKKNIEINLSLDKSVSKRYTNKVSKQNFSSIKSRLFESITEALVSYDSKDPKNALIHDYLKAQSLYTRKLLPEAHDIIDKKIERAEEREVYEIVMLFMNLKKSIGTVSDDFKMISEALSKKAEAVNHTAESNQLKSYYERVFDFHRNYGGVTNDKTKELFDELLAEFDQFEVDDNKSGIYKYMYSSTKMLIGYLVHDTEKTISSVLEINELVESHPVLFAGKERIVITSLSNLIFLNISNGNFSIYDQFIEKLKNVEPSNQEIAFFKRESLLKIALLRNLAMQDFSDWQKLEKEFLDIESKINPHNRNIMYLCFVHGYFCLSENGKALKYLNDHILYNKQTQKREDFSITAELILLIINYQENNMDVLPYLITSIKRKIQNANSTSPWHLAIFNFFQSLDSSKKKDAAKLARKALTTFYEKESEEFIGIFIFSAWFKSIVNRTSYAQELSIYLKSKHK